MYRLTCKITIQGDRQWEFSFCTAVEIERDTENLTSTCKITLPKKMKWDGQSVVPVKRGDKVEVMLGYDDNNELAFKGYIRDVGFKTPCVLTCEDDMFKLKNLKAQKKTYKKVTIEQLLKDQNTGYTVKVLGEQALGQYRVTADTVAGLLGHLKDNGIRSFFRYEKGTPILYSGVLFEHGAALTQAFATGVNIVSDSSLEQQFAENMRLLVKVVSLQPDNKKKIKVEVGDADGEHRTLHCYGKTEAEAKAWGEQEIKRLKRDGLTGSFTTFGYKLANLLDAIGIRIDGEKKGVYLVKKNVIKYGTGGYRQEITLGQRVGD